MGDLYSQAKLETNTQNFLTLQMLYMINMDFAIALNEYRTIGLWIPIP